MLHLRLFFELIRKTVVLFVAAVLCAARLLDHILIICFVKSLLFCLCLGIKWRVLFL
ncbi:hypothetical protein TERTU_4101 [Teredinibacter turnerae T7901]|uniref:Uncharacterized protein n=1 Tax=Teredinibacter turnerae (strain ATCC 39867 / T7901) TaxID=377629 RepID=C5BUF5_TERTT|nr:hypothetical protein TERTU_4101 [Teredinibacter turnerae T7901]